MGWERVACIAEKTMKNFDQCCLFFFFIFQGQAQLGCPKYRRRGRDQGHKHQSFLFFFLFVMEQKDGPQNVQALFMSDQSLQSMGGKCQFFRKGIEDDNLRFF